MRVPISLPIAHANLPYPANDTLFVEKEAYEYTRHDILGQCGWYVNEFEIGEKAVREAIKNA